MILGALIDAGFDFHRLKEIISGLAIENYRLEVKPVRKKGIRATRLHVHIEDIGQMHRNLYDIENLIGSSQLNETVKEKSILVFRRLARAEARVHNTDVRDIHFHEVGATDAIIDVTGAMAAIHELKIEAVYCSPFPLGSGTIKCAHGQLPLPAPATVELTRDCPVYSTGIRGELLTPTGAAVLTSIAADYGPMPAMKCQQVGYGAGSSDFDIPNLLRVFIGEASAAQDDNVDEVAVLETSIDDMNPQLYDHVMNRLFDENALDVFLTPVQMKKNRPGTLMTVLCAIEDIQSISDIILMETTTIGLRWRIDHRIKALRSIMQVRTRFGMVSVKVARINDRIVNAVPEYEECRSMANKNNIPLKNVIEEIMPVIMHDIRKREQNE